jgi:general secretion pathway protein D
MPGVNAQEPVQSAVGGVRAASYEAEDPPKARLISFGSEQPPPAPLTLPGRSAALPTPPPPGEVLPLPRGVPAGVPGLAAAVTPAAGNGAAPITFHVDDMDVRKALEILSRQGKLNILVSPMVTGRVTIDLKEVSQDEALAAVLRACHLLAKRDGNVVYVYTAAEELQQQEQILAVRVYHLNYIKAKDAMAMVKPLLTKKGVLTATPESEVGIKSSADKAGGDSLAGNEALVVQDCERVLKNLDNVVAQLDVQPPQVLIEAIIVSVQLDKEHELGVNFALLDRGTQSLMGMFGNGAAINAGAGFVPAGLLSLDPLTPGKVIGSAASGLAEDTHGLKIGFVGNNATAFIRALETVGNTKVLASPRLLVLNKQRAEIQLGQKLGYKTTTTTQTNTTETIQFMDLGTQLRLRPFIMADGVIRMEIHPERSSGHLDSNGIPQTDTSQVTSNVMIPDAATMVIGGLIEDVCDFKEEGIPGLSHLPLVGWLFRDRDKKTTRRELVVILTPHIWQPKCVRQPFNAVPPVGAIPPPGLPQPRSLYGPDQGAPPPAESR